MGIGWATNPKTSRSCQPDQNLQPKKDDTDDDRDEEDVHQDQAEVRFFQPLPDFTRQHSIIAEIMISCDYF
jgi:hypothetical protein